LQLTQSMLSDFPGIQMIGNPMQRIALVSFTMAGVHPHDIASIADQEGVALRAGHHCAMPLMNYFNVNAATRVSFGIYNSVEDVEQLGEALQQVQKLFKRPKKVPV
jgi:cysteine desulfurase/selenocysteine lyase